MMFFKPAHVSTVRDVAAGMTLGLVLAPVAAEAISRYDPTTMRCAAIQAAIASEGAVILKWRPPDNILRFDRYVAGDRYCDADQRAKAMTVPSADQAECPVYACRRYEPWELFPFGPDRP
jgi:hypothetical protein